MREESSFDINIFLMLLLPALSVFLGMFRLTMWFDMYFDGFRNIFPDTYIGNRITIAIYIGIVVLTVFFHRSKLSYHNYLSILVTLIHYIVFTLMVRFGFQSRILNSSRMLEDVLAFVLAGIFTILVLDLIKKVNTVKSNDYGKSLVENRKDSVG